MYEFIFTLTIYLHLQYLSLSAVKGWRTTPHLFILLIIPKSILKVHSGNWNEDNIEVYICTLFNDLPLSSVHPCWFSLMSGLYWWFWSILLYSTFNMYFSIDIPHGWSWRISFLNSLGYHCLMFSFTLF